MNILRGRLLVESLRRGELKKRAGAENPLLPFFLKTEDLAAAGKLIREAPDIPTADAAPVGRELFGERYYILYYYYI